MTAALEGGEWSAARPGRTLSTGKPGNHCTGGWVGPTAGLDECVTYSYEVYLVGCVSEVVILKVDKQLPTTRTNFISSVYTRYTFSVILTIFRH